MCGGKNGGRCRKQCGFYVYEFNVSNLETGHNGFIKCNLLEWPLCAAWRMMTCMWN